MDTFQFVGETLRRLRKESGRTLEEISVEAGLGRGQLSRIENGHQSATLKTLAKVLAAQGISRAEFFRRYDLVEAERFGAKTSPRPEYPPETSSWPAEVREVLSRVESFMETSFPPQRGIAQGAIELGEYLVAFRVMPRPAAGAATVREPQVEDLRTSERPKPKRRKLRRSDR